jgi:hypothetical protein
MFSNCINRIKLFNRRFNLDVAFLGLATLTPLVIVSFFIHPSLDDFSYTQNARDLGFAKAMHYFFQSWNGRYSVSMLMSINPLVWNWQLGYRLFPIILLVLFFIALYEFINQATFRLLSLRIKLTGTLCVLIVYVHQMPSLSQGLYWMPASVSYQLANISMLFLFAVILRIYRTETYVMKTALTVIALFLIVFIIGLNEISMLILFCLLAFISIIKRARTRGNRLVMIAFLIGAGCAAYFVFSSPGNVARASVYPGANDFNYAFRSSFWRAGSLALNWAGSSPLLLLTILFVPVCFEMVHKNKSLFLQSLLSVHPIVSMCVYYALLVLTLFPAYWSMGCPPPERVENVTCFVFTIGWYLNVLLICNYCVQKGVRSTGPLPGYAVVIIFIFIFCSMKIHSNQTNNIGLAWYDLLKGTAASYNKEMKERYATIRACRSDMCEVDSLDHVPVSIFYDDIEADENDWKNQIYASYFSKKAIRLRR